MEQSSTSAVNVTSRKSKKNFAKQREIDTPDAALQNAGCDDADNADNADNLQPADHIPVSAQATADMAEPEHSNRDVLNSINVLDNERLRRTLEERQNGTLQLRLQVDDIANALNAASMAATELRNERASSQGVMECLQEEFQKERTNLRQLQDECSSDGLRGSLNTAKEQLRHEKERSHELEGQVRLLTEQLSTSTSSTLESTSLQTGSKPDQEQVKLLGKLVSELQARLTEEKETREKDMQTAAGHIKQIETEKISLDTQYKNLLGRVSTIKSTLGERLKSDAEELAQTKQLLRDVEEQNSQLNETIDELQSQITDVSTDKSRAAGEVTNLRTRLNLAQQNWLKERENLNNTEKILREKLEAAQQAAQDWEVIAVEERSVREQLSDRVIELEDQYTTQKLLHEKLTSEQERDASIIEGLRRALQEIQNGEHLFRSQGVYLNFIARRKELREIVESMQAQIDKLIIKCHALEQRAKEAESRLRIASNDLERVRPFEKEAKEKNLLIGKLRHEAVTLNDHLRKALRMLKRDNADDKIDKQLVTNVLLQFVTIQRGDTKKYEVLQLIASLLDWSDEQREKAGLLRPGTASVNLNQLTASMKTPPLSPFHRSPSTPLLSDAYDGSKQLWSSVLDAENS